MLFLQLTAAADTLLVQQLPPIRSTFEEVVVVASGLTSILTLVLLVVLLVMIASLRAKAKGTKERLDELLSELRPMAASATEMYKDVRAVAAAANEMMSESRETVVAVNERVRETVDTLADRVDEMSALIGRVSRSAERVATVASTAIGGIKLGARALGFGRKKKKKKRSRQVRAVERDATERPRVRRRD